MTDPVEQTQHIGIDSGFGALEELKGILAAAEEYRDLLIPEWWVGAAATAKAVALRIEGSGEPLLTCTPEEWRDLTRLVEAAWRHTNRPAGSMPIVGLHQIAGLSDANFANLLRRCTVAPGRSGQPLIVHLDGTRQRQLAEILSYVKEIFHQIDPDMYRVEREEFDACTALLIRAAHRDTVVCSRDELRMTETVVHAAWTYSYRGKGAGLDQVKEPEFDALSKWLSEMQRATVITE
jgi:hypothetical protein